MNCLHFNCWFHDIRSDLGMTTLLLTSSFLQPHSYNASRVLRSQAITIHVVDRMTPLASLMHSSSKSSLDRDKNRIERMKGAMMERMERCRFLPLSLLERSKWPDLLLSVCLLWLSMIHSPAEISFSRLGSCEYHLRTREYWLTLPVKDEQHLIHLLL